MSDRTNRESQTREKQARVADWRPPSALEAPDAPVGYKHRWIRESVMEYDDRNNVHKRRREGYELVRADQRNAHYQHTTQNQMEAVDRDWMRESNAAMPKLKPQRSTSVSFGGPKVADN